MRARSPIDPLSRVGLAPWCTMGVGGPAQFFVEAHDEGSVVEALRWATRRGAALRVLGGGSNLVVADAGVDGLVVKMSVRGIAAREIDGTIELTAAAGESWDDVVRHAVEANWAGLECLSGIPGLVGATPVQNVGAYGQEVSDTVTAVRALDCHTGRVVTLSNTDCGFGYRDSLLKSGQPGRYVVLAVTYGLRADGAPVVRYADVEQHLAIRGLVSPSLADVRQSVLDIRRKKSMVLDSSDPNRRSCGSFFMNPVVPSAHLLEVERRVGTVTMPRWLQRDGRVKLSAAWLIERAGFARGDRDGAVGLSTRHALAIVAHDDASASDVAAFARRVRDTVEERFSVRLVPEPVLWGFGAAWPSEGTTREPRTLP